MSSDRRGSRKSVFGRCEVSFPVCIDWHGMVELWLAGSPKIVPPFHDEPPVVGWEMRNDLFCAKKCQSDDQRHYNKNCGCDPREPGSRSDDLSGRFPCHAVERHRAVEVGMDCPRVIRVVEDGRT
jgi:hypothetical protein